MTTGNSLNGSNSSVRRPRQCHPCPGTSPRRACLRCPEMPLASDVRIGGMVRARAKIGMALVYNFTRLAWLKEQTASA